MKDPQLWIEQDLNELISLGVKESIDLDYKECNAILNTEQKKTEISKDISAFANSAGGTIVYGMIENGHVPIRIDRGYDPNVISKEWLEQVINSRIQRRIKGVRINQIDLSGANSGKVIYVVTIPQSADAPHQASNKKFYKRYNFQSIEMEEYEIRDLSHRAEVPDLAITFNSENSSVNFIKGNEISDPINLVPLISNNAIEPANYAVINLLIDSRLEIIEHPEYSKKQVRLQYGKKYLELNMLATNWAIPGKIPIFQDALFSIHDPIKIGIKRKQRRIKTYLLGFIIKSPRMITKQLFTTVLNVNSKLQFQNQNLDINAISSIRNIRWQSLT